VITSRPHHVHCTCIACFVEVVGCAACQLEHSTCSAPASAMMPCHSPR
jgi:hypothetical protein